ncbi:MAG: polysaccharide biosynthesis/export family protein [Acidobacteriota bacterium]
MAEAPVLEQIYADAAPPSRFDSSASLRGLGRTLRRRWRTAAAVQGVLLTTCLIYWLAAPRQYESRAQLALRLAPASALHFDGNEGAYSGALASGQVQLETQANVLRSDELAWQVILGQKLYGQPAFAGDFASRFPGFNPAAPRPEAQAWLLDRFQSRVQVRTIPRTLILEVRFRCGDASLSAQVVTTLLRAYAERQAQDRVAATAQSVGWMQSQLTGLKASSDRAQDRLLQFQKQHGLLIPPESLASGGSDAAQHLPAFTEVDELGRELVAASSERILREAEYRAALDGDPELILASDPKLQGESGNLTTAEFRQLRGRQSDLQQEQAQLSLEHGPNFPRVQEIRKQLQDVQSQLQVQDARLRAEFKAAWQTAAAREQLVRSQLQAQTGAGQGANDALSRYEAMRQEADASHALYLRMREKVEEAEVAAPEQSSPLEVIDPPRVAAKPVSPNAPLDFGIALFVGFWMALGGVLIMDLLQPSAKLFTVLLSIAGLGACMARAQAPTPSTSGLPTGVATIPGRADAKAPANPNSDPRVWTGQGAPGPIASGLAANLAGALPGPIVPGDMLDVSEFHTPEFHSSVRVAASGAVELPMIGEVKVQGLDEAAAAKAIATALLNRGVLLHPQVSVLITVSIGQDVTILGEVARPGIYPFGPHHRLLDVISAASGLTPAAGALVAIYHRDSPETPQVVALAEGGAAPAPERNPELLPGDMIRVSRTGLVYVVGDVLRPGGFAMEPGESMTVLRALSLAWGPSMNAALKHAVLIRERDGGRSVTTLNLRRILQGRDPDLPIQEHDIVYVPDSAAKSLWNRTMESVVQSTAGVSIYAAMVYSQRF